MAVTSPRPPRDTTRAPKRQHRKVCSFCVEKINYIDYKEISRLRRFVSDRGKILPRRVTEIIANDVQFLEPRGAGAGAGVAAGRSAAPAASDDVPAGDEVPRDVDPDDIPF